jgi:hypothetical protein
MEAATAYALIGVSIAIGAAIGAAAAGLLVRAGAVRLRMERDAAADSAARLSQDLQSARDEGETWRRRFQDEEVAKTREATAAARSRLVDSQTRRSTSASVQIKLRSIRAVGGQAGRPRWPGRARRRCARWHSSALTGLLGGSYHTSPASCRGPAEPAPRHRELGLGRARLGPHRGPADACQGWPPRCRSTQRRSRAW